MSRPESARDGAPKRNAAGGRLRRPPGSATRRLAKAAGLHLVPRSALRLARRKAGRGFTYLDTQGRAIRDKVVVARLAALAVPPAYTRVRYAEDPQAHLQAIGRDAAGRLQYRYHPGWDEVRARIKAERLACFAEALGGVRRRVSRDLALKPGARALALAAVVELVMLTAIRAGEESYARAHGTRGAATLLKSNLRVEDAKLTLSFKAKGGRRVVCQIEDARLEGVVAALAQLPGRRLFQYRDGSGTVRAVTAREVNAYLKELAGVPGTLKDIRTLVASADVLDALAREAPAPSVRGRNAQVLGAVRAAAQTLHNTPAICRKSYVAPAVVAAFESGALARVADTLKRCRSPAKRAAVLAELIRRMRRETSCDSPARTPCTAP